MAECESCELIKKKTNLVYEDELVLAVHAPMPAAPGHILVLPKEHLPILEVVPDKVVGSLFSVANKLSSAVFEKLQVQGTNIIVQNGTAAGQLVPHMQIHIIPRNQNDGLNFEWTAKAISEEEMSTVELKLKEEADKIGVTEKEKPQVLDLDQPKEVIETDSDDYRVKSLKRIP